MEYVVNMEKSEIHWKGFQKDKSHSGSLKFKYGKINTIKGEVRDGYLLVDMHSLDVTPDELSHDGKATLIKDLKSDHFFDVENHPSARFEVREVRKSSGQTTHMAEGELTIRGITQKVEIPVNIVIKEDLLQINAHVSLIRTRWNINYMIEESYGRSKVLPEIEVSIHVVAESRLQKLAQVSESKGYEKTN